MAAGLWEISHITGTIIKSPCIVGRGKERRATLSLDEECPLVTRRVPMDLAHTARMHCDDGSRGVTCGGEGQRVDNLDGPSGDFMSGLFREMVGITLGASDRARNC